MNEITDPAAPAAITVECDFCGARHAGTISHARDGVTYYEVVCSADWLTDWYADFRAV